MAEDGNSQNCLLKVKLFCQKRHMQMLQTFISGEAYCFFEILGSSNRLFVVVTSV